MAGRHRAVRSHKATKGRHKKPGLLSGLFGGSKKSVDYSGRHRLKNPGNLRGGGSLFHIL